MHMQPASAHDARAISALIHSVAHHLTFQPDDRGAQAMQLGNTGQFTVNSTLLFRWREQQKDARHFAWLQKRMRTQLELGSTQTQCSRTANTCANLMKMWPALWTFLRNPLVPWIGGIRPPSLVPEHIHLQHPA